MWNVISHDYAMLDNITVPMVIFILAEYSHVYSTTLDSDRVLHCLGCLINMHVISWSVSEIITQVPILSNHKCFFSHDIN